jgi:membrane protease YdiL (CAAX protease family)
MFGSGRARGPVPGPAGMKASLFLALLGVGTAGAVYALARAVATGRFERDALAPGWRRGMAVALLFLTLFVTVLLPFAAGLSGSSPNVEHMTAVSVFGVHMILVGFLIVWYLLSGRPGVVAFLSLRTSRPGRLLALGIPVGAAGWLITVLLAVAVFAIRLAAGPPGQSAAAPPVSPAIPWIVSRPVLFRVAIVVSAMVVEEAFFRGFLQPRLGAVPSTLLFIGAHGVYGEPLMLIAITVIATVLAITFALSKNVLPCMTAHGTFDAIQMFVVIPYVLKNLPA